MKTVQLSIIGFLFTLFVSAQEFTLSAELRPRYENQHGFKTLLETDADGANFISQRTRVNFDFKKDVLQLKVKLQNVRIWGDVGTLSADDNATALHEAWASLELTNAVTLKFGRQEIKYDDSRIFGNVDWAQQARSHDALLAKINLGTQSRLDIGLALNSDSGTNTDQLYSNIAGYKTFQYAWFHTPLKDFKLSVLVLNTGIEYENTSDEQEIDYSQTIGTRITYKKDAFAGDFATYFQTGDKNATNVAASYFTANLKYKLTETLTAGLGGEYLSGKDTDDVSTDIKSFNPLFGTNHKFNGWMDYFYVGNHNNSVGLIDINMPLSYAKNKFGVKLVPHLFYAAAKMIDNTKELDANLGTEIDLSVNYTYSKDISFSGGFSKMFATDSMEFLKGGDTDENNSWAWVMITIKPTLFSNNK